MKIRWVLCGLCLVLFSQIAVAQNNPVEQNLVEQEVRFAKIEVTLSHLNETLGRIDRRLDTMLFAIMGLLAAFSIPIFILLLQMKMQLRDFVHDVGTPKDRGTGIEGRVDGLEKQMEQSEQRTEARLKENREEVRRHITELSITTQKQLNQIREALAVQLGIVLEPEDED